MTLYSTPMRRMLTLPHPSRAQMLRMTHRTSNGIEKVALLAMQQIPVSLLHNLAELTLHLIRLLLRLVPRVPQAPPHRVKRARISLGGICRRTPLVGRHTHYMPFQNLLSHFGTPLTTQVQKRSSLPADPRRRIHLLVNMPSALLNTASKVTQRRGRSLLPATEPKQYELFLSLTTWNHSLELHLILFHTLLFRHPCHRISST